MYNVEHDIVVDQFATTNKTLVLKSVLSRTTDTIIAGQDITRAVLEKLSFQKNAALVPGCALLDNG